VKCFHQAFCNHRKGISCNIITVDDFDLNIPLFWNEAAPALHKSLLGMYLLNSAPKQEARVAMENHLSSTALE
jgi:hypothetical protein